MFALSMTIRFPGSARVSSAGDGVLAIANFLPRSFTPEIAKLSGFRQQTANIKHQTSGGCAFDDDLAVCHYIA
jgi:hypothetical protein